jgi:hypothetical protein
MNEKKFEKAIDVLLQQQAQFYADLGELKEIQKEAEKRVNVLERVSLNLYNTSVEQHSSIVEQGKNIARVTDDIKRLSESQQETNERLNAVIFMAEKFFGGNGKSKK